MAWSVVRRAACSVTGLDEGVAVGLSSAAWRRLRFEGVIHSPSEEESASSSASEVGSEGGGVGNAVGEMAGGDWVFAGG